MRKLLVILALASAALAQKPPSFNGFLGIGTTSPPYIDYYRLYGGTPLDPSGPHPFGDTYYFAAWAPTSMLSLFPDPTGLPIIGWYNDGESNGGCTGWMGMLQLSKLPSVTTAATTSNTLITSYPCMAMSSDGNGWTGELTGPTGSDTLGTWKGPGGGGYFRNGRLLMNMYRQTNTGNAFGDSTLIMSPDAGQTIIDYGTYSTYPVTLAVCAANVVTLTTSLSPVALTVGTVIYVHDITGLSGFNGKQTLNAGATITQITYNSTCTTGTATVGASSAFGLLQSLTTLRPAGPANAAYPGSMMWPASGGSNPMTWQMTIDYGQDGSFNASGVETACDPTVYVCGTGSNRALDVHNGPMILWRVPVGQEMIKASYQFYTCSGYNANWPAASTVCDGNLAGSWTSTIGSATTMRRHAEIGYQAGGDCYTIKYVELNHAYIMSCTEGYVSPDGHFAYLWAPHPWGPWYPLSNSTEFANTANWYAFSSTMGYGSSTSGNVTSYRMSNMTEQGYNAAGGSPAFNGFSVGGGRPAWAGNARKADFVNRLGATGTQAGMGHRFCASDGWSGSAGSAATAKASAGCIPLTGKTTSGGKYSLAWWVDGWDYAGATQTYKPAIRNMLDNGTTYFTPTTASSTLGWQGTFVPNSGGINIDILTGSPVASRLVSSFNDAALSASSGNASYTYVGAINITHPQSSGCSNGSTVAAPGNELPLLSMGASAVNTTISLQIDCGQLIFGNGGSGVRTNGYYYGTITFVPSTWYFIAMTVKAESSGTPTVTFYIVHDNTWSIIGGADMHADANGTVKNGMTKFCTTGCSLTPAVTAQAIILGGEVLSGQALNGTLGESAIYSGVIPQNDIYKIYRTMRADWARIWRGTL